MTIPTETLRHLLGTRIDDMTSGTYTVENTDNRPHEVVSVHVTMSGDSPPGAVEAMVAKELAACVKRFDRQAAIAHDIPFTRLLP